MSIFVAQYRVVVLQNLITSKTRVKLLMKFFMNHRQTSYLRELESEFGGSSNAIRLELNRMEGADLLQSHKEGNKKMFQANREHPLYSDIHNILLKHTGIDLLIESVTRKLGGLHSVYLVGHFARGQDNRVIDLIIAGSDIKLDFLYEMIRKTENHINRKIRYLHVDNDEISQTLQSYPEALLLWENEGRG